jgi:hypothetical protein
MLTKEQIEKNSHIPTEEIKKDIFDTEVEIARMEQEIRAFEILGDKMSMVRAGARESGIKERKVFIEKLKELLQTREGIC